ncbi:MAG: hypothetical protein KIT09_03475 [Bryobacteraceae bacterium]|nr:hypothetical protein [Bryobacteraceae bacterium]
MQGVVNAASQRRVTEAGVAVNEIISIFGSDLGPAEPVAATPECGAFPRSLGGVRVVKDGEALPLLYVSDRQINTVTPFLGGIFEFHVEFNGVPSHLHAVSEAWTAPGVFTFDGSGTGAALVIKEDGTLNGRQRPARRGSVGVLYATGLGRLSPDVPPGEVVFHEPPLPEASRPPASIGGQPAEVLYAGAAPGSSSASTK